MTKMEDIVNQLIVFLNADAITLADFGGRIFLGIEDDLDIVGDDEYPFISMDDGGEDWLHTGGDLCAHFMRIRITIGQKILDDDRNDAIIGGGGQKGILQLTYDVKNVVRINQKMNQLSDGVKILGVSQNKTKTGNGLFVRMRTMEIEYNNSEEFLPSLI